MPLAVFCIIGAFNSRRKVNKWLPAGPPDIPNSCWTETISTLLVLRKPGGGAGKRPDSAPQSRRNLIHLIYALLDGDVIPLSQHPSQFRFFSFEGLLKPGHVFSIEVLSSCHPFAVLAA
jgi:hypothetical protein